MYCLLTAFGGYGSFFQEYLFRLLVHPAQLQLNWLQAVEYHQSKKSFCSIILSIRVTPSLKYNNENKSSGCTSNIRW
jgi:hypothetical protein